MAHRIVMPSLGMYTAEGKLVRWLRPTGTRVEAGEPIVEIETEKAVHEIEAPAGGILHAVAQPEDNLPVEALIGYVLAEGESAPTSSVVARATSPAVASAAAGAVPAAAREVRATPIARRLASEHKIDLTLLTGSGPGGRIVEADIRAAIANSSAPAPASPSDPVMGEQIPIAGMEAPIAKCYGQDQAGPLTLRFRRERLPLKKRTEARYLSWAVQNTLPCSVSANCITRGMKDILASKTNGQVAPLALMVFETARLLRKYSAFNAISFGDEVGYYEDVDIGVAMDDGSGLVVPVIRHADNKNLFEIADELRELTVIFVEGKLTAEQLNPGTFTITDLSAFGTSQFQPMLNRYQSAILGIGAEQFLPGHEVGSFTLTLTFDHSVSEGRTAALFLRDLKDHLESYEQTVADHTWGADAHCARCLRTAAQLSQLHEGHVLVRSEVPRGMICSLCLAGY